MDDEALRQLLAAQAGVVARRQLLALGGTDRDVARMVRRRELTVVHPGVYVDHTGPLSWLQRAWAAVLFSWPAVLCHASALRAAEGPGRHHRRTGPIHVAVDRHRRLVAPEGVRLHRLVRLEERALWNLGPPRLRYEDAALDVALEAPSELEAIAALAAACQSRRTTARRLLDSAAQRVRVPRRSWIVAILRDIAEGTCSVLEHGYLTRVERPHGLSRAQRQARATASVGIVYRDAEYDGGLVVELDGRLFHDSAEQRDLDFERDLDAAIDGRSTVRLSWGQVFGRPCSTAAKIGLLLEKRGWTASTRPCGDECTLRDR